MGYQSRRRKLKRLGLLPPLTPRGPHGKTWDYYLTPKVKKVRPAPKSSQEVAEYRRNLPPLTILDLKHRFGVTK